MRIFLLLLLCCTYHFVEAQSKDEREIRASLMMQKDAWNRADLPGFMDAYWRNDSLQFIGKQRVTYGWQNTFKNYQKSYPEAASMGVLSFDILQVERLSANHYFVVGKWSLVRAAGNLSGHFSLLYKKIGKRWLIVSDHSS